MSGAEEQGQDEPSKSNNADLLPHAVDTAAIIAARPSAVRAAATDSGARGADQTIDAANERLIQAVEAIGASEASDAAGGIADAVAGLFG